MAFTKTPEWAAVSTSLQVVCDNLLVVHDGVHLCFNFLLCPLCLHPCTWVYVHTETDQMQRLCAMNMGRSSCHHCPTILLFLHPAWRLASCMTKGNHFMKRPWGRSHCMCRHAHWAWHSRNHPSGLQVCIYFHKPHS